ncbi:MAG: hypothetical protein COA62_05355 [Rhodobiaceae bacterium]|nr:MAG: hypothetical protein COA62_05355 [Rhodobiaceae bacterium]
MVSEHVKQLRENLTDAELRLWHEVRRSALGHKFRRQHPLGEFTVGFICLAQKLIVELEDAQPAETEQPNDDERTLWLQSQGYRILKVGKDEVLQNIETVLQRIQDELKIEP